MNEQFGLFGGEAVRPALPAGFRYQAEVISRDEESTLVAQLRELPLREFEFHSYTAKRRVASFGWRYDFADRVLHRTEDIPSFLLSLREVAASFAGLAPNALQHVLVTEYGEGSAIGWHRDKDVFGDIVGISLLSPCTFRLRRKSGAKWERASITAEPRSAYLLRGESRTEWEHSIPGVEALRYSITFRNLRVEIGDGSR